MKLQNRLAITLLALALALLTAVAPVVAQERVDLIILLDSSRSMLRYYNQVVDFVVSDAIRLYLRFGDGFHLMNFADTAQLEVAQVLRTEEDVRTVLSRLYLLYPLGRNTDLITALRGVTQYTSGLGSSSSKYIILITDGMHSPSPGSSFASHSADEVRAEMERSAARIRERGWIMRIVQVPFNGAIRTDLDGIESRSPTGVPSPGAQETRTVQPLGQPSGETFITTVPSAGGEEFEALSDAPGTGDYLSDIATALGTGIATFDPDNVDFTLAGMVDIVQISYPEQVKARSRTFKIRLAIKNPSTRRLPVELEGLHLPDGSNILASKAIAVLEAGQSTQLECSIRLPDTFPEDLTTLEVEPRLANDVRASPAKGTIAVDLRIPALAGVFSRSASLLIFLLILIAAISILILVIRYIRAVHRRAEEPVLQAFMGSAEAKEEQIIDRGSSSGRSDPGRLVPGRSVAGRSDTNRSAANILEHSSSLKSDRPDFIISDREARNAALLASVASKSASSQSEKQKQTILETAASTRSGEDRSRLLDQWSPGDRARYVLPLKTTNAKGSRAEAVNAPAYAYEPKVAKPGTLRVELRVRNQNPFIGSRNIKTLHAGRHKSIGGKSSDFMVFLLPVPKRIADIHYDGQSITIVPVKPAFFPDYSGPIEANFGEDIRLVNSRGKELFIRFERYTPPLEKLNRLLHCIEVPGVSPELD